MGKTPPHPVTSSPGEYEIKVLRNGDVSRPMKFTVGPDGRLALQVRDLARQLPG